MRRDPPLGTAFNRLSSEKNASPSETHIKHPEQSKTYGPCDAHILYSPGATIVKKALRDWEAQ